MSLNIPEIEAVLEEEEDEYINNQSVEEDFADLKLIFKPGTPRKLRIR